MIGPDISAFAGSREASLGNHVLSGMFGGITAAGTLILAQRDEAAHPVTVEELLDRMERESLGTGGMGEYRRSERSRSAERR